MNLNTGFACSRCRSEYTTSNMVQTRSSRTKPAESPIHTNGNANDHPSASQIETTPSTFNASLEKFRYVNDTEAKISAESSPRRGVKRAESTDIKNESDGSSTPLSAKRRRTPSKYAPPSKYAHLSPLKDVLEPNLICVFVGTNPGIKTATAGHAYAHPSNMFWKLLHSSGCTDRRCRPEEDVDLPRLYAMGNTNIVERPTKDAAELSKAEMAAGTPILEAKIRQYKPEAVCIVGKGIWEAIWRWRYGKNPTKEQFKYGWQDEKENMGKSDAEEEDGQDDAAWTGARVFVASSTSGLSASTKPAEKEEIWRPFGEWVKKRRTERSEGTSIEAR
ncbi:G/U mismatch-specific DNA glycosylase [Phyllosticta citribraziliensis]|uniref:G/U mismatch-specific DNA glycosylase n=1 Tax=Phyllosticta citribraziliensis TaxID=989973 RepID=A0ABR1M073_9PEZI